MCFLTDSGQSNVPNVIVDKKGEDSDDDDNFIAKEEEPDVAMELEEPPPVHTEVDEEGGEHGMPTTMSAICFHNAFNI